MLSRHRGLVEEPKNTANSSSSGITATASASKGGNPSTIRKHTPPIAIASSLLSSFTLRRGDNSHKRNGSGGGSQLKKGEEIVPPWSKHRRTLSRKKSAKIIEESEKDESKAVLASSPKEGGDTKSYSTSAPTEDSLLIEGELAARLMNYSGSFDDMVMNGSPLVRRRGSLLSLTPEASSSSCFRGGLLLIGTSSLAGNFATSTAAPKERGESKIFSLANRREIFCAECPVQLFLGWGSRERKVSPNETAFGFNEGQREPTCSWHLAWQRFLDAIQERHL